NKTLLLFSVSSVPSVATNVFSLLRSILLDLLRHTLVLLANFRRHLRIEVLEFEHLPNLELALIVRMRIRTFLRPIDRLGERLAFPHPKSRDQLLRFRERTIDYCSLAARESHTSTLRAGLQTIARKHHARLHKFLVEFAHRLEHFRFRQFARF